MAVAEAICLDVFEIVGFLIVPVHFAWFWLIFEFLPVRIIRTESLNTFGLVEQWNRAPHPSKYDSGACRISKSTPEQSAIIRMNFPWILIGFRIFWLYGWNVQKYWIHFGPVKHWNRALHPSKCGRGTRLISRNTSEQSAFIRMHFTWCLIFDFLPVRMKRTESSESF